MGEELLRTALQEELKQCRKRIAELETQLGAASSSVGALRQPLLDRPEDETEGRDRQRRREVSQLEGMGTAGHGQVAGRSYGQVSLAEAAPDFFLGMVEEYSAMLELAIEERVFKVSHDKRRRLHAMSSRLGFHRAGPRDVVDLYLRSIAVKVKDVKPLKAVAYKEEGRMLLLELMGYLVSFYRNYFLGLANDRPEGGA